eukprot:1157740-Pelagomonas_calceolata.AAC.5
MLDHVLYEIEGLKYRTPKGERMCLELSRPVQTLTTQTSISSACSYTLTRGPRQLKEGGFCKVKQTVPPQAHPEMEVDPGSDT